jgi:hypothetical protein
MNRLDVLLLVATIATGGCNGQSATQPSAGVPPAPAVAPQPTSVAAPVHVVGRVIDGENNPVAGAKVTRWDSVTETTTSDLDGAFAMTMALKAQDRSFWVTVEKPGYETSELNRNVDTAATTSLRLHQSRSIAAGESWGSVITADDSACGYHWGYFCRRVRVRSESSGTLTLEVVSDAVTGLGLPVGPIGFPQQLERRLLVPVTAGSETSIDVAANWPLEMSAAFTLYTSVTQAR